MKQKYRNITLGFLGIYFLLNLSLCKKNSLPQGIVDEKWREESSELVSSYCQKLANCTGESPLNLKDSTKNLIQERLNPANCAEKFRKSNAYLLANEDPEKIKKAVRGCFQIVANETCEKIQGGVLKLSEDCNDLQLIQSRQ
ncbi:LA_2478/LA_2722/LA_4182 family protein [Leptospira adleri]|uniref:Uncharacterized protein n=1 Tax=Leptospira adleri TaxID=2023186 RepID=A0A2M9YSF5_9LEPT|nr:hypothetical protein [Leptospira adleri]PJZ54430.1 hypothetical protein CH380_05010 [Leptospira adleri]PJZ61283.1 hypothetical protein CH376_13840 [Leptospira adleri]TGM53536.1 hypothetical protein EHQ97_16845 [Leptospira adleri]